MNILNLEGLKTVGQVAPNTIINADCLEAMKYIVNKSIDCIICDLPYGITFCKWDMVIPFEPLWEQYKRIIKPNGAIVLFGSQPFSSALVTSNPKWFKYQWVWNKNNSAGFATAKIRPFAVTEEILIFGKSRVNYYPQMEVRGNLRPKGGYSKSLNYRIEPSKSRLKSNTYYPKNIINISNASQLNKKHPTQKPVALIEYLLKTHSLEGELILDNTAGSGTLAIAAINTDRNYICIEKDEHYFEVMRDRIERHDPNAIKPQPRLPKKKPISNEYIQLSLFNDCLDGL